MGKSETTECLHICTQAENIAKLNLVLLGNGDLENGVAFKVLRMADSNEIIKADIREIKDSLTELALLHKQTYEAATTAASAIERYKEDAVQFEAGKQSIVTTTNQKSAKWLQTIAVIIAAVMMIFGYINLKRDSDTLNTKFNNIEASPAFKAMEAPVLDTLIHK